MSLEQTSADHKKEFEEFERSAEALTLVACRAEHVKQLDKPPELVDAPVFKVDDFVSVLRGRAMNRVVNWPLFSSKSYGPCCVVQVHQPRYTPVSFHGLYA